LLDAFLACFLPLHMPIAPLIPPPPPPRSGGHYVSYRRNPVDSPAAWPWLLCDDAAVKVEELGADCFWRELGADCCWRFGG
jgi:hypothetical protein